MMVNSGPDPVNSVRRLQVRTIDGFVPPVASLGLVSPGAATDCVIFFSSKTDDLF